MSTMTATILFNRASACGTLLLLALAAAPVEGEPTRFDWRYHAGDGPTNETPDLLPPEDAPNPVVLPIPKAEQDDEEEDDSGWHWLTPRIADTPGGTSNRTAVQLADQAQQDAMAQRHSPLNSLLPGSLRGLAPMAVESGVEWRF